LESFLEKEDITKLDYARVVSNQSQQKTHDAQKRVLTMFTELTVPEESHHRFNTFYSHMDVQYKIIFELARFSKGAYVHPDTLNTYTINDLTSDACGYSLVIINPDWKIDFQETYYGHRPLEFLLKTIHEKGTEIIQKVRDTNIPLIITEKMKKIKNSSTKCPLCQAQLNSTTRLPAYNHNHWNGVFYR